MTTSNRAEWYVIVDQFRRKLRLNRSSICRFPLLLESSALVRHLLDLSRELARPFEATFETARTPNQCQFKEGGARTDSRATIIALTTPISAGINVPAPSSSNSSSGRISPRIPTRSRIMLSTNGVCANGRNQSMTMAATGQSTNAL